MKTYSKNTIEAITNCCLIAADIDKTIIEQYLDTIKEETEFKKGICHSLLKTAELGVNIALITGNSMNALCSRFIKYLVKYIYSSNPKDIIYLEKFHFFCNSGGVYARIEPKRLDLNYLKCGPDEFFNKICFGNAGNLAIIPKFIDPEYTRKNCIASSDISALTNILKKAINKYFLYIDKKKNIEKIYEVKKIKNRLYFEFDKRNIKKAVTIEKRKIIFDDSPNQTKDIIQITIKPILSFRHLRKKDANPGQGFRKKIVGEIQKELDKRALWKYTAKQGGFSSIDITMEKLDKAYAVEFLIDKLNIKGIERLSGRLGSNTLYFGDEVIVGGGNDYPVTRIPGLLVFAVNTEQHLIPVLSGVIAADYLFTGSSATCKIMDEFNMNTIYLLEEYENNKNKEETPKTAVENFKSNFFIKRIKKKIEKLEGAKLSAADLNLLHTVVTLMTRHEETNKKWLNILFNELDQILSNIHRPINNMGIGTSHPDNRL